MRTVYSIFRLAFPTYLGFIHLLTSGFYSFGINKKEPPLIGLYPLQNNTNITQTPADILSFISSASATVATTLPNFLLPSPTFTTPPYAFNTSVSASVGAIVTNGLANTTYSAIFGQKTSLTNVSALPEITPSPPVVTLVVTNSLGATTTTTESVPMMSVTLGLPSTSGARDGVTMPLTALSLCVLTTYALLFVQTW